MYSKEAFGPNGNWCYKCSIGKHSQHSIFTGKGLSHGLWKEAWKNDVNVCECPNCYDPNIYGKRK